MGGAKSCSGQNLVAVASSLQLSTQTSGSIAKQSHKDNGEHVYRTRFPGHTFMLCRLA